MSPVTIRAFRWLALVLIAFGIIILSLGPAPRPTSPTATLPRETDSTTVAEILSQQPGDNSQSALVFFTSDSGDPLDASPLFSIATELAAPIWFNEDSTAAILPVEVESYDLRDNATQIAKLREITVPGMTVQVTGPAAINADLAGVFDGADILLLAVTGLIVAVLLIVTYRSPILWLIPLLVIGLADRVAAIAFTWVLSAFGLVWNESTSGIVSVLVFGAGTNYALLLISRYRDELRQTDDRFTAMARAWRPTFVTVSASGFTVIIGVACLLLSAVPTTRGLGLAAVIGIIIALIFALFVLPGVLVGCKQWIFWPKIPMCGEAQSTSLWDTIGAFVRRRPQQITALSLLALIIACSGALGISTGLTASEQFINTPESISASTELSLAFPDQDATPATIATKAAAETTQVLEAAGITVREAEPAGQWQILEATGDADTNQLRSILAGTDALVGGQDAQLIDAETAAAADRRLIFPLILALIFIVLALLLRSIVAPLIMTATVLVTNIAALGIGWWISTAIFGFSSFDSATPLYSFVFLVALGIDYSIFLVTRTAEEAPTHGTKEGVLYALSATGGVITSAGILLAAVFAALGVLPLVSLAQIGIIIFIGVLLDTLVVRTILIPAIVQLLGEKFWWPKNQVSAS